MRAAGDAAGGLACDFCHRRKMVTTLQKTFKQIISTELKVARKLINGRKSPTWRRACPCRVKFCLRQPSIAELRCCFTLDTPISIEGTAHTAASCFRHSHSTHEKYVSATKIKLLQLRVMDGGERERRWHNANVCTLGGQAPCPSRTYLTTLLCL